MFKYSIRLGLSLFNLFYCAIQCYFGLFCLLFLFDLPVWTHVDSLAGFSSVTSEPQISDPFAPEPTLAPPAATAESATTSATTTAAAADEVDLFGGQLVYLFATAFSTETWGGWRKHRSIWVTFFTLPTELIKKILKRDPTCMLPCAKMILRSNLHRNMMELLTHHKHVILSSANLFPCK